MVKMENRAGRGIRLVTETITEGIKEYIYEIGWHVPIGKFYLEESITHLDRCEGHTTSCHPTFAGHVGYADRIQPLIKWIENKRNVKVEIDDPNLSANEEYSITDGQRILKKYPKWKTKLSPEEIIA
jgi:hypothetical protein